MGGLARPPRPRRPARLTQVRWIARLEDAPAGGGATPTIWLVRPDGPEAQAALRTVRPAACDLADAAAWRDPARGAERLARRLLLRALAAAVLGAGVDAVEVAREEGGRPHVAAPRPLHASVARRDGWAALAVCARPVGVDLEAAEPVAPLPLDGLDAAARRWIEAEAGAAGRARRFAQAWTAREAYLKAGGAGLAGSGALETRPLQGGVEVRGPEGAALAQMRRLGELLACAVVLA